MSSKPNPTIPSKDTDTNIGHEHDNTREVGTQTRGGRGTRKILDSTQMCFSILPVVINMNIMSAKSKTNENLLSTKINNGHQFMIPKIDKLQGTSDNFFMT